MSVSTSWKASPSLGCAVRSKRPYRRPPPHRLVAVEPLLEHALATGEVRQLSLELVQPSCDEPSLEPGQVTSSRLGEQRRTNLMTTRCTAAPSSGGTSSSTFSTGSHTQVRARPSACRSTIGVSLRWSYDVLVGPRRQGVRPRRSRHTRSASPRSR